jgi:hypothetical protein
MPPIGDVLIWIAVLGICLGILRRGWGLWLVLPACVRFILWPLFWHLVPALPIWVIVVLVILTPIVLVILFLRGGQAVLGGIFGRDVAVRVVARALIHLLGSLFGGFGRGRLRRVPPPVLPRPNAFHFHPRDHGDWQ